MSTVNTTRIRLQARRGEWPSIGAATGLSYWWLIKFGQGRIADPGLSKIEKLLAELDKRDQAEAGTQAAA